MNPYKNIVEIKQERITEAQKALHLAVLDLYGDMEVYEMSVKRLCEKANVARSTFYTYYTVIDDIMLEIEDELIYRLLQINRMFGTDKELDEDTLSFFEENLTFVIENKTVFYLFLLKRVNNRFIDKWKRAIKYHFYERIPKNKQESDRELILELIAAQVVAAYTFWLHNPYEINISMVKKIILNILTVYQ